MKSLWRIAGIFIFLFAMSSCFDAMACVNINLGGVGGCGEVVEEDVGFSGNFDFDDAARRLVDRLQ